MSSATPEKFASLPILEPDQVLKAGDTNSPKQT